MSLNGILIINAFLDSPQVRDTYEALLEGAGRASVNMKVMRNDDFFTDLETGLVKVGSDSAGHALGDADFILFWNKDVFLGRSLERMGHRLFNPADPIEYCDNKALTYEKLGGICRMPRTVKIPMTFETVGYTDLSFEDRLGDLLGYPYVIKECYGSYGGQVYLATDKESARMILKSIEGKECLAQEFIATSKGRDIRAYVVGDRVVAAMERNNPDDFRSNITGGGKAVPITITKEQEQMAVACVEKLGMDFAGVDLLYGKNDEPLLCEVNSNAQFIGLRSATGIDISDALFEHIKFKTRTGR